MDYSFEVTYLSLIFFLLRSHMFFLLILQIFKPLRSNNLIFWFNFCNIIFLFLLCSHMFFFSIISRHWFFTLSFGFLEVLTSKFWVHVLQYMKLSWQISIAIVMHCSFEVTYFSLIFFLLLGAFQVLLRLVVSYLY